MEGKKLILKERRNQVFREDFFQKKPPNRETGGFEY